MLNIILRTIIGLIALSFLSSSISRFLRRAHTATWFKLMASAIIWISVLVLSIFPSVTHEINRIFGFGENLNTLIFLGFVIVFIIVFKLLSIIERTERTVTDLVRKDALRNMIKVSHEKSKR
ncbi:MAG: DUF2304 domain-containing protein [Candidatus Dojkabacteria bacterium]|nr:DUF2304 domain-containing protein [Candidatus Dojkabacteria bacterium]